MASTVTVACKLPHGLKMRVFAPQEYNEYVMGGGSRTVTRYVDTGKSFTVNGWSHAQNSAPHCTIQEGFALTMGVDKDFWDTWYEQNKTSALVENNLIWAYEKIADGKDMTKDFAQVKSGLERLDLDNLPKLGNIKVKAV